VKSPEGPKKKKIKVRLVEVYRTGFRQKATKTQVGRMGGGNVDIWAEKGGKLYDVEMEKKPILCRGGKKIIKYLDSNTTPYYSK